jgi:hypothetical protein
MIEGHMPDLSQSPMSILLSILTGWRTLVLSQTLMSRLLSFLTNEQQVPDDELDEHLSMLAHGSCPYMRYQGWHNGSKQPRTLLFSSLLDLRAWN